MTIFWLKLFVAFFAAYMWALFGVELTKDTQGAVGHEQTDTVKVVIVLVLAALALYVLGWGLCTAREPLL